MRLIIAGGRDFQDYDLLCDRADAIVEKVPADDIVILSGMAAGADSLGVRYAEAQGLNIDPFEADWDKYGRAAGAIRNHHMAVSGTHLLAFWDGESPGTANMIAQARHHRLHVEVVMYE